MTAYQFGYFAALAACSIAGYKMCADKGRDPWLGAAMGFFLGLIGLIIVALLKKGTTPAAPGAYRGYAQPTSGPGFPVQPARAPQPAVAAGGQPYVAPRVPQYTAPQPPQPPAGPQPS